MEKPPLYILGKWQSIHDKAGNGWASSPDILRRLLTLPFETRRNSRKAFQFTVLNKATVDVLGCDYITAFGVAVSLQQCLLGYIYHIGVGSNVVCSTTIGNARASMSGMDNGTFHAFLCLYVLIYSIHHK